MINFLLSLFRLRMSESICQIRNEEEERERDVMEGGKRRMQQLPEATVSPQGNLLLRCGSLQCPFLLCESFGLGEQEVFVESVSAGVMVL